MSDEAKKTSYSEFISEFSIIIDLAVEALDGVNTVEHLFATIGAMNEGALNNLISLEIKSRSPGSYSRSVDKTAWYLRSLNNATYLAILEHHKNAGPYAPYNAVALRNDICERLQRSFHELKTAMQESALRDD